MHKVEDSLQNCEPLHGSRTRRNAAKGRKAATDGVGMP